MKLRTSKKTIFVHPNGYFEVVEVSGTNLMGDSFCFHEAVYTPNRDKRGVACEEIEPERAIRFTRITPEGKEEIRAMCRSGMRTAEIAQKVGRSTQYVRDVTKDLREPKEVRFWSAEEKEKAREMWFNGCSFSQIGRFFDRNPSSVRDMLQREVGLRGRK